MTEEVERIVGRKLASVFVPWAIRHPRYLNAFARLVGPYRRSEKARRESLAGGVRVPLSLIVSITSRCNLRCSGCYADAVGTTVNGNAAKDLPSSFWEDIIQQASDLGVFIFVVAGGEPFLYPGILDICRKFKDRWFIILTNGTILTEENARSLKKASNVSVVVSIEGGREMTDDRRGAGVYDRAMATLQQINELGVMTGFSTTVSRMNYQYWMDEGNLDSLMELGARLAFFLEYIPTSPVTTSQLASCSPEEWTVDNDLSLMLLPAQRSAFRAKMLDYRANKPIYNVHSPGDEEMFGGCVSAGRGFAHITPSGDLTPCPVSNIATHNLTSSSLREGLASPLFQRICEEEHLLETEGVPCALFAHPEEVDALAREVGAYRTNDEKN